MAIDAVTQKKLYDETDARFWSQTGYNPGKKLDPHDPYDQSMVPVWQAIYKIVANEYDHGGVHGVHWTVDQPEVVAAIADAKQRVANVEHQIDNAAAALTGGDVHAQQAAVAQATAQHDAAQVRTKQAGAQGSPHVVDPALVAAAAQQAPAPTTPAQVAKGMQIAVAPQHAHDVLSFHMNAAGQGVPDGAAPSIVPVPVPVPAVVPVPDPHDGDHYHVATKWTPLVALGAVGAAVGLGTLIVRATGSGRPRRRASSRRPIVIAR